MVYIFSVGWISLFCNSLLLLVHNNYCHMTLYLCHYITSMLQNDKMFEIYYTEYFILRFIRTWYNSVVYQKSIDDSTVYETTVLIAYLSIEVISEISLFLLLYFLFFKKISEMNKNLSLLLNAFKSH